MSSSSSSSCVELRKRLLRTSPLSESSEYCAPWASLQKKKKKGEKKQKQQKKKAQRSALGTMAQWCNLTLSALRPMNTYFPHLASSFPEGGDRAHRPCLRFRGRPGPLLARFLLLSSCCCWSCCCCNCCFSLKLQQSQHDHMIMLALHILILIINLLLLLE